MIANAVALGVLWTIRIYNIKRDGIPVYQKRIHFIFMIICTLLTIVFLIIDIVYTIIVLTSESGEVASFYLRDSLPLALFFILVPSLAIFLPKAGKKSKKALVCIVLVICLILGVTAIFPLYPYKITSDPMVIDNGDGYSIVFSTNDTGTGYINYTYEDKEYTVYDETTGRLNCDSKIHTVTVPYEHLKDNSYIVGSTRVIEEYSYGSRLGKEIKSDEYTFSVNESSEQNYLVISDWHTHLKMAKKAISYLGEYDGIILMGDATPGLDFEDEFIINTVEFAGNLCGGEIPIIYVRGNHEARGAYSGKVEEALGLNEFYRINNIGPVSFIVLDSSEDKEDSHVEYGGLDDYSNYRKEMLNWLTNIDIENSKVIALSHSWKISDVEEDISTNGYQELERLGVRLMISGHTHDCRLVGVDDEEEEAFLDSFPNIIAYMDGGKTDYGYTASKLIINDDEIQLIANNNHGVEILNETFTW